MRPVTGQPVGRFPAQANLISGRRVWADVVDCAGVVAGDECVLEDLTKIDESICVYSSRSRARLRLSTVHLRVFRPGLRVAELVGEGLLPVSHAQDGPFPPALASATLPRSSPPLGRTKLEQT